jgi:putative endonuclease
MSTEAHRSKDEIRPAVSVSGTMFSVYILASRSRVLYIGVTSNLARRLAQHRSGHIGFTKSYNVGRLVLVEAYSQAAIAIAREKQLKGWRRSKKVALIEQSNPRWQDLAEASQPLSS